MKGKYVELIEENLERAVIGRNRLENIWKIYIETIIEAARKNCGTKKIILWKKTWWTPELKKIRQKT